MAIYLEVRKSNWRCDSCGKTGFILFDQFTSSLAEQVRRAVKQHEKDCGDPDIIIEENTDARQ